MKKQILLITIALFITSISFSQKAEFKYGEKIEVEKITKGMMKGTTNFYQNTNKIKYMKLFRELEEIDICSENMKIARKYRNRYVTLVFCGLIFANIPGKKQSKYFNLAIKDYNKSLE